MKTCTYKIVFNYCSPALKQHYCMDSDVAFMRVDAPEGLSFDELDAYLHSKYKTGYLSLVSFEAIS